MSKKGIDIMNKLADLAHKKAVSPKKPAPAQPEMPKDASPAADPDGDGDAGEHGMEIEIALCPKCKAAHAVQEEKS